MSESLRIRFPKSHVRNRYSRRFALESAPTKRAVSGLLAAALVMSSSAALAEAVSRPRPDADTLAMACSGCHGTDGHSRGGTPVIAGRPAEEFVQVMSDFKSGRRKSSIMNRIAAGYQEADFAALAEYFADR